jgi:lipopolysaccharide/colanic/teichoic acid biosynthesis glycosyltransferase
MRLAEWNVPYDGSPLVRPTLLRAKPPKGGDAEPRGYRGPGAITVAPPPCLPGRQRFDHRRHDRRLAARTSWGLLPFFAAWSGAPDTVVPLLDSEERLVASHVASGALALPAPFPIAGRLELVLKRVLDVFLSALLLVLVAPVVLAAMALIRLTSPGPALFVQRRCGHLGREFEMFKLRTMVKGADSLQDQLASGQADRCFLKVKGDARVTPLGRILRRYSIDELPQLVNVLNGDMSLIGPRPLLPCDVRSFPRDRHARRFEMRPGMTGLWQVSGRNDVSDEERMRLDLDYVERWSLVLDLEIVLRTPLAVVSARGAC